MARVTVNKNVLNWALERSRLSVENLERKFPKIRQWITGESHPTLRQLENLAKETFTPFGYFFLDEPPAEYLPIPYFRTLKDVIPMKPSPELFETIWTMQRRQAWMREYLLEEGQEPLPFVKSARADESPSVVAQKMRRTLGLSEKWATLKPNWRDALNFLRETIEKAGIMVVVNSIVGNNTHRRLNVEEFRGFVLVDDIAPLAFVNGADSKAAQMFTLSHELAHIFLGSSAAFDLREMKPADDPMEEFCDKVAAEFLVPEKQLYQIWKIVRYNPRPFQEIARMYKVSEIVAARRALDLALINKDIFLNFYNEYQKYERRIADHQPQGGDFYANQNLRLSRRFAKTVIEAVKEGKLLYYEAYRLTGLYGKTFEQYEISFGIT